jgi:DNA adenine methylase
VSLTAIAEGLAEHAEMVELDSEVAAVWQTLVGPDNNWLRQRILAFDLTPENVKAELDRQPQRIREKAFCTILKNRVYHGGILTKGAGMLKVGENGRGIASRWYPGTLANRMVEAIERQKRNITAIEGDGFAVLEQRVDEPDTFFFIDPPYLQAGKRLYTHFDVDHSRLLALTATLQGHFLLTYDDSPEVRKLAGQHGLAYTTILMKTTHHLEKRELLISDNFDWL